MNMPSGPVSNYTDILAWSQDSENNALHKLSQEDQLIVDVAKRSIATIRQYLADSPSFSATLTRREKFSFYLSTASNAISHLFNRIFHPVLANVEKVITDYTTGFNTLSPQQQKMIQQTTFSKLSSPRNKMLTFIRNTLIEKKKAQKLSNLVY